MKRLWVIFLILNLLLACTSGEDHKNISENLMQFDYAEVYTSINTSDNKEHEVYEHEKILYKKDRLSEIYCEHMIFKDKASDIPTERYGYYNIVGKTAFYTPKPNWEWEELKEEKKSIYDMMLDAFKLASDKKSSNKHASNENSGEDTIFFEINSSVEELKKGAEYFSNFLKDLPGELQAKVVFELEKIDDKYLIRRLEADIDDGKYSISSFVRRLDEEERIEIPLTLAKTLIKNGYKITTEDN